MAVKKSPPLTMHLKHPEVNLVMVKFNGNLAEAFIEVDVLGMCGVRYAEDEYGDYLLDDDGFPLTEKVYGKFTIEWLEDLGYIV